MSYGPLSSDTLYLRKLFFGSGKDDLLTDQCKTDAELFADSMIEAELGTSFVEVAGKYPPLIIVIAQLLGSAQVYRSLYAIHISVGAAGGEKSQADILEDRANGYIERINSGSLILYDSAGVEISGFGQTGLAHSVQAIYEKDEDIIFDIRAEQEQLKKPAKAYGEPEYEDA